MFTQFRIRYPNGGLISEFVTIDHGKYVVRALIQDQGITLATGLAAADTVEEAEDRARIRALEVLALDNHITPYVSTTSENSETNITSVAAAQEIVNHKKLGNQEDPLGLNGELPETLVNNYSREFSKPEEELESTYPNPVSPEPPSPDVFEKTEQLSPFPQDYSPTQEAPPEVVNHSLFEEPLATPEMAPVPSKKTKKPKGTTSTKKTTIAHEDPRIEQIDREMLRLGWTATQGRQYLLANYGKKSRLVLTDEELQAFLDYLQGLPS